MENVLEVLKIVDAALQGNSSRVTSYVRQLAEKLERSGDKKSAERILKALDVRSGIGVTPAKFSSQEGPVDSESRLALADKLFVEPGQIQLFLDEHIATTVSEFVRFVKAADRFNEEGIGISPSLLMFGPPGCGKTELAKLIAAELRLPLIIARSDTLISSYLGSTAKNIRLLFEHTASQPCSLFLDEFDAIAKLRDDRHELGELKRVVVSLLQNIDAVRGHTILLAATNHEHLLDPAIWRRFSYKLRVDLPNEMIRRRMFEAFLKGNYSEKIISRLAEVSTGMSPSDIREICDASRRESVLSGTKHPRESEIFRRLLVRFFGQEGLSPSEIIVQAKKKFPGIFTHRVLAEVFDMSPGNISHILQKSQCKGGEP